MVRQRLKRTPLTLAEHRALAAELLRMRDYLRTEGARIAAAYGAPNKPARRVRRAVAAVDALRAELEAQMLWDARRWPESDRRVVERASATEIYFSRGAPADDPDQTDQADDPSEPPTFREP